MSTHDSSSRPRQVRAEPQSFRASAFSASLAVKDLERSVRWYTDAIGFIVTQRHERAGRLATYGWPLLSEPADATWGPRALRVADPDGYRLVFSAGEWLWTTQRPLPLAPS
jgi:hypothetical protein